MSDRIDVEVRLRPGVPEDAPALAAYHRRCWVQSFADLLEPGVVAAMNPHHGAERWPSFLGPDGEFTTIVAEFAGHPIGHVTVRGNEIVQLFVDPDHHGRGLGRRLLEVGESIIADGGHERARLDTIVGNEPAIALYRSAGWVVTDRIAHNDDDGVVFDEHVLVKTLHVGDVRSVQSAWSIDAKPADSVLEAAFTHLVTRFGLQRFEFHPIIEGWEIDFRLIGTNVLIERDGWTTHGLDRDQFERDRRRDDDLLAAGWLRRRFTYRAITATPADTARRIRRLIALSSPDSRSG